MVALPLLDGKISSAVRQKLPSPAMNPPRPERLTAVALRVVRGTRRHLPFIGGAGKEAPQEVRLTSDQLDGFARELDELRARIVADLGDKDRQYIYNVIKAQRGLEVAGRALFLLGFIPPVWLAATAALSASKILDNLEIGHNVMHGQYDWMKEPSLNSRVFDWDMVSSGERWRYSHNYRHHTHTNIIGLDRDIGFGVLRMDEAQPWHPVALANPLIAFLVMTFFEWAISVHVLELELNLTGDDLKQKAKEIGEEAWSKILPQVVKDFVVFPALTGPLFPLTFLGNLTANITRNVWGFIMVFCGHFPAGVQTFTEEETQNETRGEWYLRQLLGTANFRGSRLFHIMSGNLGYQIEHHLYPDLPSGRYHEMAPQVEALCAKYGLPYNAAPLRRQVGTTWARIFKLALPPSWVRPEQLVSVIVEPSNSGG